MLLVRARVVEAIVGGLAADVLLHDPYIADFMSTVGGGTMNQGRVSLHLKPRRDRPSADAVIRELQPKLAAIPGIRVYLSVPPVIRIGGRPTKSLYQFTLQSPDMDLLYPEAAKLEAKILEEIGFDGHTV